MTVLEFFLALGSTGVAVFAITNTLFDRADESYKLAKDNMEFLNDRYREREENPLIVRLEATLGTLTLFPYGFQIPYRYITASDGPLPSVETRTLNTNWPASLNFVEGFPLLTPRLRTALALRDFLETFPGTVDPETMTDEEMDVTVHEDEFALAAVQALLEVLKARPLLWIRRAGIAMMAVGGIVALVVAF